MKKGKETKQERFDRVERETLEMLKLYKDNISIKDIAEQYGYVKATVIRRLKKHVELRKNIIPKEKREKIYELHLKGYSNTQIGKELNMHHTGIRAILCEYGIIQNPKYLHLVDNFKEEYQNGESLAKIGKKYGVSSQTVLNYLRYSKVEIRKDGKSRRLYKINDDYFKELNDEKIYNLGVIFSTGTIQQRTNGSPSLDLCVLISHKDLILNATKDISDRDESSLMLTRDDGCCTLRIISQELSDDLEKLGIKNKFPKFDTLEQQKIFFKGYFEYSLTVRNMGVYVSFGKYGGKELEEYFKQIGVDTDALVQEHRYTGYLIQQSGEIEMFVRAHRELLDKILEYNKINGWNSKWSNFIRRFREEELNHGL